MSDTSTRREFMKKGAAGAGAALATSYTAVNRAHSTDKRPNILFIMTDQQGQDVLSAHGCNDVHTPHLDRLVHRGVSFTESHSTSPVCSPARSSMVTGRMPEETGVISNNRAINASIPNMGQWFRDAGYETIYAGKWHLPGGYPDHIEGFTVLNAARGQGDLVDNCVSRVCEAYLKTRDKSKPFLLILSIMQPHDICYWAIMNDQLVPEQVPFGHILESLPELPPNHTSRPPAPAHLDSMAFRGFTTEEQWRYYLYVYYRQTEMADADIGRVLNALEDSGEEDNTMILFTSDHGDGRGRHMHVQKWYPYEESVKVPMVVSFPGRIQEGILDTEHLVSGVDIMSTFCDFAGIASPSGSVGMSMRPVLEGRPDEWRDFVVADTHIIGRMVRTAQYKYVQYKDDPIVQLFDMKNDPWEMNNLYQDTKYADIIADHRNMLADWQTRLQVVEPSPLARY